MHGAVRDFAVADFCPHRNLRQDPHIVSSVQAARTLLHACEAAAARAWSSAVPAAFAGESGRPRLASMLRIAVTEPASGTSAGGPGEPRRLLAR